MKSKDNIEAIRLLPCSVCARAQPSDPHHWKSKGAGGGDELSNLVPLCHPHHVEFHASGRKTFWRKYGDKVKASRRVFGLPDLVLGFEEET